jgi:hypothetical protein
MRIALLFFFSTAALADGVAPGNWELSVTSQLGPQAQAVSGTQTQCFTEADARDPGRILGGTSGTCEFSNRRDDGSTFSFNVVCSGPLPMKGSGAVRYTPGTLEGDLDLTDDKGGFGMRTTVKGRRLGPC